jgi:hypothetical protein
MARDRKQKQGGTRKRGRKQDQNNMDQGQTGSVAGENEQSQWSSNQGVNGPEGNVDDI